MKEFELKKPIVTDINFEGRLSQEDMERIPEFLISVLGLKNEEELVRSKSRIEKANGVGRIFVHPFYNHRFKDSKSYESIKKGILRHITSKGFAPAFFWEEVGNSNPVLTGQYTIPTLPGMGRIDYRFLYNNLKNFRVFLNFQTEIKIKLLNRRDELKEKMNHENSILVQRKIMQQILELEEHIESQWLGIREEKIEQMFYYLFFRGLGIKKVVIGGMYIEDAGEYGLYGCMGYVTIILKRLGIGVTLSRYHMDQLGRNISRKDVIKTSHKNA
jgi:hypothetical protein